MNKKIVIDMPLNTIELFNKMNNNKGLTKEWLEYRIEIFMRYTVQCIKSQTDQSFLCVVHYLKSTEKIVQEELAKYPKLPDNIVFSADGDYLIKEAVKGFNYLYKMRLDTDNIIHPTFIENLNKINYKMGLRCIIGRWGYVYDTVTNRLALWDHNSSAFNTHIYKVRDYIRDYMNSKYMPSNIAGDHMNDINLNHEFLYANYTDGRSYLILVHGKNLSNDYDDIVSSQCCTGHIIDENIKKSILDEFKIVQK